MPEAQKKRLFGIGWRPVHQADLLRLPPGRLDWLELISENFMGFGGRPRAWIEHIRQDYPLACHGVALSIGSVEPLSRSYLKALKELVDWLQPELVSDHLSWTSWQGKYSYDLLPLPRHRSCLEHLITRVQEAQDFLQRPLVLENPSVYLDLGPSDCSEVEFLAELCRRSGCQLLLDLNNCQVNQQNLGWDPWTYLDQLKPEWVRQFHLAGHRQGRELSIDTHDQAVPESVWKLFSAAVERFPNADVIVEWDENIPSLAQLLVELDRARKEAQQPATRLESRANSSRSPHVSLSEPPPLSTLQLKLFQLISDQASPETERDLLALYPMGHAAFAYYRNAYGNRLLSVLELIYPKLRQKLGTTNFARLMRSFIEARASDPYAIDLVGQGLSEFLLSAKSSLPWLPESEFLVELSAWEWLKFSFPFAADDNRPPLSISDLASWQAEDWEQKCFHSRSNVILLKSSWNTLDVILSPELLSPKLETTMALLDRGASELSWERLDSRQAALWAQLTIGGTLQQLLESLPAKDRNLEGLISFLWQEVQRDRLLITTEISPVD